jgi:hypothetical protein
MGHDGGTLRGGGGGVSVQDVVYGTAEHYELTLAPDRAN